MGKRPPSRVWATSRRAGLWNPEAVKEFSVLNGKQRRRQGEVIRLRRRVNVRNETYHRLLSASGYMILSAIVVMSIAYLPIMANTILSTLNIVPNHLM